MYEVLTLNFLQILTAIYQILTVLPALADDYVTRPILGAELLTRFRSATKQGLQKRSAYQLQVTLHRTGNAARMRQNSAHRIDHFQVNGTGIKIRGTGIKIRWVSRAN